MKTKSKAKALHEQYRKQIMSLDKQCRIPELTETAVKSQHFVQRSYLEAFCSDLPSDKTGDPVLWVHTESKRWQSTPSACATENFFYCHDLGDGSRSYLGETFLADLEGASMEVLRAAQQGNLPTKLRDRFTLTGYVAMALARTPSAKALMHHAAAVNAVDSLRNLFSDPKAMAAYCKETAEETGKIVTPDEVRQSLVGGQVRVSARNRGWSLRMMAELMMYYQQLFMRMKLFLLNAEGASFVTSDRPVHVIDPARANAFTGGAALGFDMTFPLSKSVCLVGTNSAVPGRKSKASLRLIESLNQIHAREADRFVYSPFESPSLQTELARRARPKPDEEILVRFENSGPRIIESSQQ